jgi:hypothetical protein
VIGAITAGLFSAGVTPAISSYESIATVTVGAGGQANATFSSIPSGFQHLQIRFLARDNRATTADTIALRFNSDSGSNYRIHYLLGDGSAASAGGFASTSLEVYRISGATSGSNIFGAGVIDILDYTSINKNKTVRALGGVDQNGSGEIVFGSGLYFATPAAITSITILPTNGTLFNQYSSFALYGIKG